MGTRAILTQCTMAFWLDVAASLLDNYGWEIPYIIGDHFNESDKRTMEKFPDMVFHTIGQVLENRIPPECGEIKQGPLDRDLIASMSFHENIFLKMMDRFNFDGGWTYQKRIFFYHRQVMYWKGVLDHYRPDVVLFRTTPHRAYDYILYALCHVIGIQTIMFERTALPGLIFPVTSFEKGSEKIRDGYRKKLMQHRGGEITLSPRTREHIERLTRSYTQAMPFHVKYKLANLSHGTPTTLVNISKDIIKGILPHTSDPGYLRKSFYKNIGQFKKKRLLRHYNHLARDVDLKKPYIFVALQCEPERQTCPSGGVFGNQYVMVDLLSKLVPEGWRIYVKEHVSQFKSYQSPERSKTVQSYDYIAGMPNVEFVPLSYNSFDLIDGAKASATVSGTVAWESVVRGKPAFLFGHSWYRDCEGVFVTHTLEACKAAIEKLQDGYVVNGEKVLLFAQVIEEYSFKGYIDKMYDKMKIVTYEENVGNISSCIEGFFNSNLKSMSSRSGKRQSALSVNAKE